MINIIKVHVFTKDISSTSIKYEVESDKKQ